MNDERGRTKNVLQARARASLLNKILINTRGRSPNNRGNGIYVLFSVRYDNNITQQL